MPYEETKTETRQGETFGWRVYRCAACATCPLAPRCVAKTNSGFAGFLVSGLGGSVRVTQESDPRVSYPSDMGMSVA